MANEDEIRYSNKTGTGWLATPEDVTDGAYAYQVCPALAVDSNDNVHVAWAGMGWGTNTGTYNIYYKMKDKAGVWGSIEYITDVGSQQGKYSGSYMGPSIAIDSGNNVHVVWTGLGWGTNTSYYNIQYRNRTSGTWQTIESITDIGQHQISPTVSVDTVDDVHIVWSGKGWNDDPGNSSIQHTEKTSSGWELQETIVKHNEAVSGYSEFPTIPNSMWAMHPNIGGTSPNIPNGVSLVYMNVAYDDNEGYNNFVLEYLHIGEAEISDLIEDVEELDLPLDFLLTNPLERAESWLNDKPQAAKAQLRVFIRRCTWYHTHTPFLTESEYNNLVETAQTIMSEI
jgi:hypothetical protein